MKQNNNDGSNIIFFNLKYNSEEINRVQDSKYFKVPTKPIRSCSSSIILLVFAGNVFYSEDKESCKSIHLPGINDKKYRDAYSKTIYHFFKGMFGQEASQITLFHFHDKFERCAIQVLVEFQNNFDGIIKPGYFIIKNTHLPLLVNFKVFYLQQLCTSPSSIEDFFKAHQGSKDIFYFRKNEETPEKEEELSDNSFTLFKTHSPSKTPQNIPTPEKKNFREPFSKPQSPPKKPNESKKITPIKKVIFNKKAFKGDENASAPHNNNKKKTEKNIKKSTEDDSKKNQKFIKEKVLEFNEVCKKDKEKSENSEKSEEKSIKEEPIEEVDETCEDINIDLIKDLGDDESHSDSEKSNEENRKKEKDKPIKAKVKEEKSDSDSSNEDGNDNKKKETHKENNEDISEETPENEYNKNDEESFDNALLRKKESNKEKKNNEILSSISSNSSSEISEPKKKNNEKDDGSASSADESKEKKYINKKKKRGGEEERKNNDEPRKKNKKKKKSENGESVENKNKNPKTIKLSEVELDELYEMHINTEKKNKKEKETPTPTPTPTPEGDVVWNENKEIFKRYPGIRQWFEKYCKPEKMEARKALLLYSDEPNIGKTKFALNLLKDQNQIVRFENKIIKPEISETPKLLILDNLTFPIELQGTTWSSFITGKKTEIISDKAKFKWDYQIPCIIITRNYYWVKNLMNSELKKDVIFVDIKGSLTDENYEASFSKIEAGFCSYTFQYLDDK